MFNLIIRIKYRINIKIGTGQTEDYFVNLTNEIFDMDVLSVSYEKLEQ